jgi:hypothetical protein
LYLWILIQCEEEIGINSLILKQSIINMLLKIVLGNQIRLFDCKDTLTLEALYAFIDKTFSNLKNYSLYYFDEENDQIIL